jgi:ribosomal protein S18 acetylase RimI-like enzyme
MKLAPQSRPQSFTIIDGVTRQVYYAVGVEMARPDLPQDILNRRGSASRLNSMVIDQQSPSVPAADVATADLLANPIFHSLATGHADFALVSGAARRYPAEIGPLAGIADQSDQSYEDLRALAGRNGIVGLFLKEPYKPRVGWTLLRDGAIDQMVLETADRLKPEIVADDTQIRRLTTDDVPQMVALATLTEPGPFGRRTIELGPFFGCFWGERLVAMAGRRMHLPEHVEVSAVCTHPDARGRGFAAVLMSKVMREILESGKTPMLHTYSVNANAIRIYETLGFVKRRTAYLGLLKNES